MRNRFWELKIPTWGAFLVLSLSLWGITYLLQSTVLTSGRASPDIAPQHVKIVNITSTSFTVVFTSSAPTSGAVRLEEDRTSSKVFYDIRDSSLTHLGNYYSHFITVSHVLPTTLYSFVILSGSSISDNNGSTYHAKTALSTPTQSASQTVAGSILLPSGDAAGDTLVYLSIPQAQDLAAITDTKGTYSFSLNGLLVKELNTSASPDVKSKILLTAYQGQQVSTIATILGSAASLPPITLSNNYDFADVAEQGKDIIGSGGLTVPVASKSNGVVAITYPQASQSLTDSRPMFRGTARAATKVSISIHSDARIITSVTADKNGLWSYRPPTALSPGSHTITISGTDQRGIARQVTRNFSVFASGAQVADIVPTATLTPTVTITPLPTSTPTATVTVAPTITATIAPTVPDASPLPTQAPSPTDTPILTYAPTDIPLPTVTPLQFTTPIPTIANTGTSTPVVLTSISIIFIIAGTSLLFLL